MALLDAAACSEILDAVTAIAARAAAAIGKKGAQGTFRVKADGSPVTAADEAADDLIRSDLGRLVPMLPVVSEEHAEDDSSGVEDESYFLVDPLDGTREYIEGRDEYTVNIALMTHGAPILGVIVAPALGLTWRGIVGRGAESLAEGKNWAALHTRKRPPHELLVVVSRSHLEARTRAYLDRFPGAQLVQSGSSIKFCRVAEGAADLYPRLAPTRDWDVAAGHAILQAAGGSVVGPDERPLIYGSAQRLLPAFVAWGDPSAAISPVAPEV